LFLEQSIGRNTTVRTIGRLTGRAGLLDPQKIAALVSQWIRDLAIKTPSADLPVRSLSGGNQQRVVLARWLASQPQLLILNGPTVGVDVGSKHELHGVITRLAQAGMGILVISDDLPELLQLCNRIILMRRGTITAEYQRTAIDAATLSAALAA
jgi:simple sugar transport system ATP-binding protein